MGTDRDEIANIRKQEQATIEGHEALVVIDLQASTFLDASQVRSVGNMPRCKEWMRAACGAIYVARDVSISLIFIREVYHPSGVSFGRELGGDEDVHCLEGDPKTALAAEEMGV